MTLNPFTTGEVMQWHPPSKLNLQSLFPGEVRKPYINTVCPFHAYILGVFYSAPQGDRASQKSAGLYSMYWRPP